MNWLAVALIARFIEGSSAVIDKRILKKSSENPVGYTFWLGIIGLASLVLVPFGFKMPSAGILFVSVGAGIVYLSAMLLYFSALFYGEASGTVVLLGALSPLSTLFWSGTLFHLGLAPFEAVPFGLLILGSIIMFFTADRALRFKVLGFLLGGTLLFGLSNVLTKFVFLQTNFVSGFVLIKIGAALAAFAIFVLPRGREKITASFKGEDNGGKASYVLNRAYAGAGSLLIYYAISLGAPALVDATLGVQFAFVFLGSWMFLKERFGGRVLLGKIIAVCFVSLGIVWLAIGSYLSSTAPDPARPILWGVTFSEKFSTMMGLDWKENYSAILSDLGAKRLRLVAYWDLIEKKEDSFDFSDLDYQFNLATKHKAEAVLVVGQKVPRWPECHYPEWTANQSSETRNKELLNYISAVVSKYKNNPALKAWQVENEPFLPFGECPLPDTGFLDQEIALVKSLDPSHPVIITDSGELSLWFLAAERGDVFGTTMYRRVNNKFLGNIDYHLPPEFFRIKTFISRLISHVPDKKYVVIELGAEPWLHRQLYETKIEDQLKVFDLPFFEDTITYAKLAGFNEYYLWGAEWWYWMKIKHNMPEFWDFAKTLFVR